MPIIEKTGIKLRKELGLENFTNVKIVRIVISSYATYFVFYNSNRPNMPITNFALRKWPFTAMMYHGTDLYHGSDKIPPMTPPMDISDFNGKLKGSLFVAVDLAGYRFIRDKNLSKVFEGTYKVPNHSKEPIWYFEGKLDEITLFDLNDKDNMSGFTKTWWKDRNRIMGNAAQNTKLIDCVVDEAEGSVTFQFLTESTELGSKKPNKNIDSPYRFYKGDKMEVDPPSMKLARNTSKVYELQIKVINALEWIDAYIEGETIGKNEVKEMLRVSDVQIFSTSPSFQFHGFNYWNTQIDSSIYPETRKPQRWDKVHGDGEAFLDKHLGSLLFSIEFFLNPMASMMQSKLKQRGLI